VTQRDENDLTRDSDPLLPALSVIIAPVTAALPIFFALRLSQSTDLFGNAIAWRLGGISINLSGGATGALLGVAGFRQRARDRNLALFGILASAATIAGFVGYLLLFRPGPVLGGATGGF
jgi:hypothetical protein